MSHENLSHYAQRTIERIGAHVHRPTGWWTPAVHGVLNYLEAVGFPYAPRVVGFDADGREVLMFIEGEAGPASWAKVVPEMGLRKYAQLLRAYHDAVAGYRPAENAEWAYAQGGAAPGTIVCHGDFGPWNVVWQGDEPVGILDWDMAFPAPPRYDVLYALQYTAPFRNDEDCLRWLRYDQPPDRKRRVEVFAQAYGMSSLSDVAAGVAQLQRQGIAHVASLATRGLQPQAGWVADGHLDEIDAQARWAEANAGLFP